MSTWIFLKKSYTNWIPISLKYSFTSLYTYSKFIIVTRTSWIISKCVYGFPSWCSNFRKSYISILVSTYILCSIYSWHAFRETVKSSCVNVSYILEGQFKVFKCSMLRVLMFKVFRWFYRELIIRKFLNQRICWWEKRVLWNLYNRMILSFLKSKLDETRRVIDSKSMN